MYVEGEWLRHLGEEAGSTKARASPYSESVGIAIIVCRTVTRGGEEAVEAVDVPKALANLRFTVLPLPSEKTWSLKIEVYLVEVRSSCMAETQ
jgi:hypothetical protein